MERLYQCDSGKIAFVNHKLSVTGCVGPERIIEYGKETGVIDEAAERLLLKLKKVFEDFETNGGILISSGTQTSLGLDGISDPSVTELVRENKIYPSNFKYLKDFAEIPPGLAIHDSKRIFLLFPGWTSLLRQHTTVGGAAFLDDIQTVGYTINPNTLERIFIEMGQRLFDENEAERKAVPILPYVHQLFLSKATFSSKSQ